MRSEFRPFRDDGVVAGWEPLDGVTVFATRARHSARPISLEFEEGDYSDWAEEEIEALAVCLLVANAYVKEKV